MVLADALELPPEDRLAFVDSACGANETARTRVLELLEEQDRLEQSTHILSEQRIESRRRRLDAAIDHPETQPDRIGRYRIIRRIGIGGMGVVYEAEQMSPRRRVALKIVDGLRTGPELERRLEAEAEIQGTLQHPGIAQVFDAGVDLIAGARRPYFVMEYIEGRVITAHADDVGLDLAGRLELLARVADAMGYAHTHGVIHRDLKPENILIKASGQPKVLDFGIARVTGEGAHAAITLTREGHIMGTLAFMAPEQIAGARDITARADVYALGVIAFELITGKPLYELGGMSLSSAIREVGNRRPPRLREVLPSAPREVETIVGKALSQEPASRYDDGDALAADIRRYLASRPILARPPSRAYRTRKFVQRHRTMVVATALCLLLLIGGFAGTSFGLVQAQHQRDRADARADDAEAAEKLANERAELLQRVANLHTQQLRSLQPEAIGVQLRDTILDGVPPVQRGVVASALGQVNFTSVALRSIERTYFADVVRSIDEQFAGQPLVRADLLQTAATTLYNLGLLWLVEDPQLRAIEIRERVLGPDHPDAIASVSAHFDFLMVSGRFAEAIRVADRVVAWNEQYLGHDDPVTIESIALQAMAQSESGQPEAAFMKFVEAHERSKLANGPTHQKTLDYLRPAIHLLRFQLKRIDEADRLGVVLIEASRDRLREMQALHGVDSPEAIRAMEEVGSNMWEARGACEEVVEAFAEALEVSRRVLGDEDFVTRLILPRLAGVLAVLGRPDESIPLSLEYLGYLRRTLGDDHLDTASRMMHTAEFYLMADRPAEAAELLRSAYATRRRVLGPGEPRTLAAFEDLMGAYRRLGRDEDRERLLLDAYENASETLSEDHPVAQTFLTRLVRYYGERTRPVDEARFLRVRVEHLRRTLGESDPATTEAAAALRAAESRASGGGG